jgi:hypothetical protein
MVQLLVGKVQPKPVPVKDSYAHISPYGSEIPKIQAQTNERGMGAVHAKMLAYLRRRSPALRSFTTKRRPGSGSNANSTPDAPPF